MIIALGADHGGFEVKEEIKKFLIDKDYGIIDCGTNSTESTNYAAYGIKVGEAIKEKIADYGIVVCTSGEGIAIAANKVKGIRCGIGYDDTVTKFMRLHNNANMIAFGAKYMKLEDILRRVEIFLTTEFEGGRHEARIDTISEYENK